MTTLVAHRGGNARLAEIPTRVEDLEAGLLLFFSRPSWLQSWAELFGHEWRHVGLTVRTGAGLMIASYAATGCYRLDEPAKLLPAYDRVGVARVFDSDLEVADAEQFCRTFEQFERSDCPYTWGGMLVGPVHLFARRRPPGAVRSLLFVLVAFYCLLQRRRFRDRDGYLCSTFVWAAVQHARTQRLRIPLLAHPEDDAAYATPSTRNDEQLARWLCGPHELWEAVSPASRAEIDLSSLDASPPAASSLANTWEGEVASSDIETASRRPRVPALTGVWRVAISLRALALLSRLRVVARY